MNFSLDPQLLATSCVPQPHASSWYHHPAPNEAGLIAFAADKLVAIYQPGMAQSVRLVMHGHQERVNCVQWIPTSSPNLLLASVSADHSLCLWQLDIQTTAYSLLHRIADVHTAPIHSLAVLPAAEDEGKVFIATAGSDKTIAVWSYSVGSNDLRLVQRIQPRKGHAVSLAFSRLTEATPLLAVGTTDSLITLFSWSPNDAQIVLKGHTDWVRSMDFMRYSPVGNKYHLRSDIADGDLLLASASQDKFIRIWKITGSIKVNTRNDDDEDPLLAKLRTDQDELNTKVHTFSAVCHSQSSPAAAAAAVERQYAVYLESVLAGHDDWVYTVQWHPPQTALDQNGNQCIAYQPTILLSASADNTMIVWYPDEETGVWTHEAQLGDPHKNILGIYGAMWGSDGKRIVGYGRNGAFHLWQIDDTRFSSADLCFIQCGGRKWTVIPSGLTGHFRPVTDMTWDVSYRYLISVSLDQTTRIWCKFHHQSFGGKDKWRELSRAQVHGYDLRCVTSMDKWRFASGADGEKIARVFIANRPFAQAVSELCPLGSLDMEDSDIQTLAMGATIPSLSLSNRAMIGGVQGGDTDEGKPTHKSSNERFLEEQGKMHASLVTERQQILSEALKEPTEEYLAQYTLWGEQEKLYGHGYELYSMAALPPSHCDPEGVLATACTCRAANSKDASIRLWSSKSMKPIQQPLESHTLTVTRLKFSHNGQFLASVGRDRVWSLWRRSASGGQWALGARLAEAHSRIIWDTAWTFDDKYFLTASRDKSVKMWRVSPADDDEVDGVTVELAASWKFDDGVTAIDSLAIPLDDDQKSAYLIAVGFENGAIQIHCITAASDDTGSILQFSINQVAALDQSAAHSGSVKRVCFRAVVNEHCKISREKYAQRICYDSTVADNSIQVELATCGDDQTVRIYKLT